MKYFNKHSIMSGLRKAKRKMEDIWFSAADVLCFTSAAFVLGVVAFLSGLAWVAEAALKIGAAVVIGTYLYSNSAEVFSMLDAAKALAMGV